MLLSSVNTFAVRNRDHVRDHLTYPSGEEPPLKRVSHLDLNKVPAGCRRIGTWAVRRCGRCEATNSDIVGRVDNGPWYQHVLRRRSNLCIGARNERTDARAL